MSKACRPVLANPYPVFNVVVIMVVKQYHDHSDVQKKEEEKYKEKFFMVRASKVGNCNENFYGESENKRQNVPSAFDKDRLIPLDKAFELRPDMKSCNQDDDIMKGKEEGQQCS